MFWHEHVEYKYAYFLPYNKSGDYFFSYFCFVLFSFTHLLHSFYSSLNQKGCISHPYSIKLSWFIIYSGNYKWIIFKYTQIVTYNFPYRVYLTLMVPLTLNPIVIMFHRSLWVSHIKLLKVFPLHYDSLLKVNTNL